MMSKTTERLMIKFGCSNCRYFKLADGKGGKLTCVHHRVGLGGKAIRYLKRCPKTV
jgi:hypothetical protein